MVFSKVIASSRYFTPSSSQKLKLKILKFVSQVYCDMFWSSSVRCQAATVYWYVTQARLQLKQIKNLILTKYFLARPCILFQYLLAAIVAETSNFLHSGLFGCFYGKIQLVFLWKKSNLVSTNLIFFALKKILHTGDKASLDRCGQQHRAIVG